ncbi:unnamed protein product, partial [Ascophyllum nodosum]
MTPLLWCRPVVPVLRFHFMWSSLNILNYLTMIEYHIDMGKGVAMGGHVLYAIFLLVICCAGMGAQIDKCTFSGNTSTVQNGRCDAENNNAECGFDGGDC